MQPDAIADPKQETLDRAAGGMNVEATDRPDQR